MVMQVIELLLERKTSLLDMVTKLVEAGNGNSMAAVDDWRDSGYCRRLIVQEPLKLALCGYSFASVG